MKVQIGDVWVNEDGTIRNVFCENNGGKFGYRSAFSDGGYMMAERKAEDIMRDSKLMKRGNINRPGAGKKCSLEDCLLFGIGTKEEWEAAPKEDFQRKYDKILPHVVLDSEGELPKVEEKGYVDCPDTIERCKAVRYAK